MSISVEVEIWDWGLYPTDIEKLFKQKNKEKLTEILKKKMEVKD